MEQTISILAVAVILNILVAFIYPEFKNKWKLLKKPFLPAHFVQMSILVVAAFVRFSLEKPSELLGLQLTIIFTAGFLLTAIADSHFLSENYQETL